MLIAATSKADKTADTLGRRGRDGNKKARTGGREGRMPALYIAGKGKRKR